LRVDMNLNGMPRQQSWEEAEPMFTRAQTIEPGNLLADIAQARLLALVNFDVVPATEVARRAEEAAPNHPLVVGTLAEVLGYMTDKDALTYCRRYLALDPLNPDAYTFMANALMFQDRPDEAWPLLDRALELDSSRMLTYEYKANFEFFKGRPAQAAATFTSKGRAEGGASEATQRCLVYFAGSLLPIDRAEPMLREAMRRRVGTSGGHEWCPGSHETLIERLIMANRLDDLRILVSEYQDQDIWSFGSESKLMPMLALADGDGDAELQVLAEILGADTVATFRGPDPPLAIFKFWIALDIARALIHKGQIEEGRQVAGRAADAILAGASAQNGEVAIDVLAAAGRIEEALDRAERLGVEDFTVMGRGFLEPGGVIPELVDEPRWQAFLQRCRARWLEEVDKFDRMVASGEIVMPVPVPKPEMQNLGSE
jgi:tetratricopeptide (TPR) repeat protein